MNFLYAPWRKTYVDQERRGKEEGTQSDECVFCQQFKSDKEEEQDWPPEGTKPKLK